MKCILLPLQCHSLGEPSLQHAWQLSCHGYWSHAPLAETGTAELVHCQCYQSVPHGDWSQCWCSGHCQWSISSLVPAPMKQNYIVSKLNVVFRRCCRIRSHGCFWGAWPCHLVRVVHSVGGLQVYCPPHCQKPAYLQCQQLPYVYMVRKTNIKFFHSIH